MTLDEQLDHHAITADVAKMAREANDEIKKLEATIVARDDELDRLNHRIAELERAREKLKLAIEEFLR
jgi:phage shock protein A